MSDFSSSYLEIEPRELVKHLLRQAGQGERDSVNPADFLEFLGLEHLSFDFNLELPDDAKATIGGAKPRALISFDDRLVATDSGMREPRRRFSVLHEIGHFILPSHEHKLYVCDDKGLSFATRLTLEREASEFAADLLFQGDRFALEANSQPVSASVVKVLAEKYRASFEAAARRLVEKNFKPCMLVVFKEGPTTADVNIDKTPTWSVRYCIASAMFKTRYFEKVFGTVAPDVVVAVTQTGRDIADSCVSEVSIRSSVDSKATQFQAEFFSNTWNIFCLLTPHG
ncbi:MAG: ImmA/IrrE family metallo-endopeptidase [Planctomycetes bacterium]|nr:ImmA/IrrE family metallo-endopeptidase [Planctomycetota bacterium]